MSGASGRKPAPPPMPGDAAVCALQAAGRLLLVRTRRLPGYWQPPGGLIEEGDGSAASAAARELGEELGITVAVNSMRLVSVEPSDVNGGQVFFFAASIPPGEEVRPAPGEILEHKWVSVDSADRLPMKPASTAFLRRLLAEVVAESEDVEP